jgi:hypothetical protein
VDPLLVDELCRSAVVAPDAEEVGLTEPSQADNAAHQVAVDAQPAPQAHQLGQCGRRSQGGRADSDHRPTGPLHLLALSASRLGTPIARVAVGSDGRLEVWKLPQRLQLLGHLGFLPVAGRRRRERETTSGANLGRSRPPPHQPERVQPARDAPYDPAVGAGSHELLHGVAAAPHRDGPELGRPRDQARRVHQAGGPGQLAAHLPGCQQHRREEPRTPQPGTGRDR